jgi:hypothetical protein
MGSFDKGTHVITFTREEADRLLDTLAETIDAQQWEIDSHIKTYGEWYRPKRVEHMKNALNDTLRMIEIISHKLSTPHEPTIDDWPLWSGLPQPEPVAYIDVETRNLSWAKLTRWETPTVVKMDKIPLYTAPPQRESAPTKLLVVPALLEQAGYVKKKEWVDLTDDEMLMIYAQPHEGFKYSLGRMVQAKLKEKNT